MTYKWVPLMGEFDIQQDKILFKGKEIDIETVSGTEKGALVGECLCNARFSEGKISVKVKFTSTSDRGTCEVILFYDLATNTLVTAGMGGGGMFSIRSFDGKQWTSYATTGDRTNIHANEEYSLEVTVSGSRVVLYANGVEICKAVLPGQLPPGQVGILCIDYADIEIIDFIVQAKAPTAFVVMQFASPYNELYANVIKPVCEKFGLVAMRADDTHGPGMIIADIVKQIVESFVIIAEITPVNANVFYELGYAHALGKPAILIAEKGTKLPFDVAPFRTLFYENSINGKALIEEGLNKHLSAILGAHAS